MIAKAPSWIAVVLSLVVAAVTAYAIAVNLDEAVGNMVKLHSLWSQTAVDYERLWSHTYDEKAETELGEIERREIEASELATLKAPNDQRLLGKWQDQVFRLHRLVDQHG